MPTDTPHSQLTVDGSKPEDVTAEWSWEVSRLFEPAPAPMAGQVEMFDPDNGNGPSREAGPVSTTTMEVKP